MAYPKEIPPVEVPKIDDLLAEQTASLEEQIDKFDRQLTATKKDTNRPLIELMVEEELETEGDREKQMVAFDKEVNRSSDESASTALVTQKEREKKISFLLRE
uniref:Uncharacterized protein n=1 Tax=Parascaris univalens TaxID=6257 RepID=A0A915ACK2_PARUN